MIYLYEMRLGIEEDDYVAIKKDVHRTFPHHKEFCTRVPMSKLSRVLNAFAVSYGGKLSELSYVQVQMKRIQNLITSRE